MTKHASAVPPIASYPLLATRARTEQMQAARLFCASSKVDVILENT